MRFFLLYPERRTPGGGHKQMRILARNLRQLGVESFLLRERMDDVDDNRFYGLNVPTADFALRDAARCLDPSDVLMLPEIFLERSIGAVSGARCRRAVYAQGGFLALLHRPRRGYARNGIEFMIGVSPYIAALGPRYLGVPAHRSFFVPYPVVRGPFADAVPSFESKTVAVCCMPRKLAEHIERVRGIVAERHPDLSWIAIDGVPESEVAAILGRNALFFSTQNGEGFGLPAIEAMSRGCIAVGYPGTGLFPHPYATRANGLWARDRSIGQAAKQLIAAVDLCRAGGSRLHGIQTAAREALKGFTEERALTALRMVLDAVCSNRRVDVPGHRLGLGGHLQALRTLQVSRGIRRTIAAADGLSTAA